MANFYGHTVDQYVEAAAALDEEPCLAALEMNISCPNIQEGGIQFGTDPASVYKVTKACRDATNKPLWVKLSPNAADVTATAKAAEDAGADALTCINTMPAMAIDVERREFRISNKIGGLCGPALKPIAVRIVYQVSKAVSIPVVGIGGIARRPTPWSSSSRGPGPSRWARPSSWTRSAPTPSSTGMEDYCVRHGFPSVESLVGQMKDGAPAPSVMSDARAMSSERRGRPAAHSLHHLITSSRSPHRAPSEDQLSELIIAVDVRDEKKLNDLLAALNGQPVWIKLGFESLYAFGLPLVERAPRRGSRSSPT